MIRKHADLRYQGYTTYNRSDVHEIMIDAGGDIRNIKVRRLSGSSIIKVSMLYCREENGGYPLESLTFSKNPEMKDIISLGLKGYGYHGTLLYIHVTFENISDDNACDCLCDVFQYQNRVVPYKRVNLKTSIRLQGDGYSTYIAAIVDYDCATSKIQREFRKHLKRLQKKRREMFEPILNELLFKPPTDVFVGGIKYFETMKFIEENVVKK